ncbi:MAG: response regulator [bacterium]
MSERKHLILAVDDDTDLLATLGDFLSFEGYEVEAVPSAEDAIARLAQIVPDLIILDISMPGMGGVGFLNEKIQMPNVAKVPVLVFTARANMENFFKDVDVAGFIAKPCDPAELLREIRRIVTESKSQGAAAGATPAGGAGGRKILIAEDEAGPRERMIKEFSEAGFKTIWVSSGPEVVEEAIVKKPDAIIMKLVMERMNGDAAAAMLNEIPSTRAIPIVLYDDTGSQPRDRILSDEGPGLRRLVRSHKPEDLIRAVRDMFPA